MPKHYAVGVNLQSFTVQNPSGGQGFADVVFSKAFAKVPKISQGDKITGNNPKAGSITNLTKTGLRYHFGGTATDVESVDIMAVEE